MSIAEDPEKTAEIQADREKLRALIKARGPACPETRRRAATLLGATLAGGVAVPPPAPLAPPPPPIAKRLGAVLLVGLALAFVVGCVPVEAIEHVREQHAAMAGHALDESLPLQARQVGADAMRGFSVQHRVLAGELLESPELPPELAPAPMLDDEGPR